MEDSHRGFEHSSEHSSERAFELLRAGDADSLRQILEQDPAASEARDSAGVSLLMHSIYRGRRDLADLIVSPKKALAIFEPTPPGPPDHLKESLRHASFFNPY